MFICSIQNQKGGSAKTSTCANLAVAAMQTGLRVSIFDTDPQKTLSAVWAEKRAPDNPYRAFVTVVDLPRAIEAARNSGKVDLVFIDTAPNSGPDAHDVAELVDFVLIPVKPARYDLKAVNSTIEIVRKLNKPALIALTACPRTKMRFFAHDILKLTGIPVADTMIMNRNSYETAALGCKSVLEVKLPKAQEQETVDELRGLWQELWAHLQKQKADAKAEA